MSVQSKTMSSVLLFLSMFFLVSQDGVDAFHVDKPMIYINFFDEVVTDNASSKFIDKGLATTSTPLNNSAKDLRKRQDMSSELLKLNDENKTSASDPYDSIFEFDMPSKADITEISVNESEVDPSTTTRFSDMMDPEFLEPEITRMFFLKAIANLIEHIMEALFTIDDTQKLSESPGFDYDLAPSRNLKKRDLSNGEGIGKLKDADQSVENKTESKTTQSSVDTNGKIVIITTAEKNNTGQTVRSNLTHENIVETITEHSSSTPSSALTSDHVSTHYSSNKATVTNTHAGKRENDAKSIAGVKSEQEVEGLPDGKLVHRGKLISQKNLQVKLSSADEDNMKMFHFSDESSVLNDEVVNKKDTHFYGGIHPAEDHDELVENFTEKGIYKENNNKSTFIVTVFLVGTTALILMILGALALAAGYFFRKSQESGNQNDTNLRSAVA